MSELTIKGIIVKVLDNENGTSKAGKDWIKGGFVVDTSAQYNPEVCFSVFGQEKLDSFKDAMQVGKSVEVAFNVSSREFNGKYYHNLDAWKVTGATASAPSKLPAEENDSLPF